MFSFLTTKCVLFLCTETRQLILTTLGKPVNGDVTLRSWRECTLSLSTAALLGRGEGKAQQGAQSTWLNPAGAAGRKPAPTGRFRAESKYKMSSDEESPSLAWSLSALMSVSTCGGEREKPQQLGFQASCFDRYVYTAQENKEDGETSTPYTQCREWT